MEMFKNCLTDSKKHVVLYITRVLRKTFSCEFWGYYLSSEAMKETSTELFSAVVLQKLTCIVDLASWKESAWHTMMVIY